MQNTWSVIRLSGFGFVGGSLLAMIRALVEEAGTALAPGALLWLVFIGGIVGAVLLGGVAAVRNFLSK